MSYRASVAEMLPSRRRILEAVVLPSRDAGAEAAEPLWLRSSQNADPDRRDFAAADHLIGEVTTDTKKSCGLRGGDCKGFCVVLPGATVAGNLTGRIRRRLRAAPVARECIPGPTLRSPANSSPLLWRFDVGREIRATQTL